MPVDIANFVARNFNGISLPAIDAARNQNALGRLQVQQAQQTLQDAPLRTEALQNQNAIQREALQENARATLSQMFDAIAQSDDPRTIASNVVRSSAFQSAAKVAGIPADQFVVGPNDDPDLLRKHAQGWSAITGGKPQLQTIGDLNNPANGVYQRNPADNSLRQITAPNRIDPEAAARLAETERHNRATEGNQAVDPQSVENTAQMIASGQMPMLSGYTLKTPWGQQVVSRVKDIAPDYQGGAYNAKAATLRQFASGTQGNTVRSLNVAISHLGTLSDLADALGNKDAQLYNRTANIWKTQTGQSAPTSFSAARDIVANEVVKAITASGGALADRQEAQSQIQAAASPAQLAGVISTWTQLLGGQLTGLRQQYEQGSGQTDFERFLSPDTIKKLEPPKGSGGGGSPKRVKVDAQGNVVQ